MCCLSGCLARCCCRNEGCVCILFRLVVAAGVLLLVANFLWDRGHELPAWQVYFNGGVGAAVDGYDSLAARLHGMPFVLRALAALHGLLFEANVVLVVFYFIRCGRWRSFVVGLLLFALRELVADGDRVEAFVLVINAHGAPLDAAATVAAVEAATQAAAKEIGEWAWGLPFSHLPSCFMNWTTFTSSFMFAHVLLTTWNAIEVSEANRSLGIRFLEYVYLLFSAGFLILLYKPFGYVVSFATCLGVLLYFFVGSSCNCWICCGCRSCGDVCCWLDDCIHQGRHAHRDGCDPNLVDTGPCANDGCDDGGGCGDGHWGDGGGRWGDRWRRGCCCCRRDDDEGSDSDDEEDEWEDDDRSRCCRWCPDWICCCRGRRRRRRRRCVRVCPQDAAAVTATLQEAPRPPATST